MKNKELFSLHQGLNQVTNLPGLKFAYAVAKNLNLVISELKLIQKLRDPKLGYTEYDSKRIELAKQYADKNEDESPKQENNNFIITGENRVKFDAEIALLQAEHQEAIDTHLKQLEEFTELLEEDCKLEFHKVKLKELPNDLNAAQVTAIMPIIDDSAWE
jgi:hypothetical protein